MTLKGFISQYFETSCEGIMWYFFEDGKKWPKCIHEPDDGDHLKIFKEDGEILFDGIIKRDHKTGWQPHDPKKPRKGGQQIILGYRVHWVQKDFNPDEWLKLFFYEYLEGNEGKKPLRAELIKNEICTKCKKNKKLSTCSICEPCRDELLKKIEHRKKKKTAR